MNATTLNVTGLLMNLVGIVLLFLFQMPFRIRTDGHSFYVASQEEPKELAKDKLFAALGWLGFSLLVAGTAAQIVAAVIGA